MRVLIIEDEKNLARVLKKGLEENSFTVEICHDGEEGLYTAETHPFDAVILDIMLPKLDGLLVLQRLREKQITVPVIMLTAKGEVGDRVAGLNTGADDYLPKPFDFTELLARLRSVIRRNKGRASSVIEISDLEIDINLQMAKRASKEIKLSAKEYRILEYLAINRDRVISRTELIEHVYDMDFDLDSNVIDVYINYLRNKIDKGFDSQLIHTVRGSGYILKEGK
jgi:DNA-binding response OmpR family regulator